jgi:hypothetical protein
MKVGLVGAQGVGKTTLAEAVSNETDLPLIFTNTVGVFEKLNLKPDEVLSFETRISIQHKILDAAIELWDGHHEFITDRTPIDMLAYTMIDINSDTRLTKEQTIAFQLYRDRCIEATNKYFTTIVLVQPGIPMRETSKVRAALDPVLCEAMNTIALGLLLHEDILSHRSFIPKDLLNLKDRTIAVEDAILVSAKYHTQDIDRSVNH